MTLSSLMLSVKIWRSGMTFISMMKTRRALKRSLPECILAPSSLLPPSPPSEICIPMTQHSFHFTNAWNLFSLTFYLITKSQLQSKKEFLWILIIRLSIPSRYHFICTDFINTLDPRISIMREWPGLTNRAFMVSCNTVRNLYLPG